MTSPWNDLDRPPLSQRAIDAAVRHDAAPWARVRLVDRTGSTNADVAAAARSGEPEGLVLVAEEQAEGRGRLDRTWVSPPRAGLTFSVLFRPAAPPATWPVLSMLVSVATAQAVRERTDLDVRIKWPNDLLVGDRKVAGLLAEVAGAAVVVGVGLNVSTRADELPVAEATSLAIAAGEPVDRLPLLLAVVRRVEAMYAAWADAGGAPGTVLPAYRDLCETLGREVRVDLPGRDAVTGTAEAVDDSGCLVVRRDGERRTFSAGDVVHVRPA